MQWMCMDLRGVDVEEKCHAVDDVDLPGLSIGDTTEWEHHPLLFFYPYK